MGGNFLDIGLGNNFLTMKPKAQAIKTKMNNQNYIKLKSFCTTQQRKQSIKQ